MYVSLEQAEAALQRGLHRCAAVLQQLGLPDSAATTPHPSQRGPGGPSGPAPQRLPSGRLA